MLCTNWYKAFFYLFFYKHFYDFTNVHSVKIVVIPFETAFINKAIFFKVTRVQLFAYNRQPCLVKGDCAVNINGCESCFGGLVYVATALFTANCVNVLFISVEGEGEKVALFHKFVGVSLWTDDCNGNVLTPHFAHSAPACGHHVVSCFISCGDKHPLISNAECYRTSDNRIGIEITQRLPILRVMAANGENYYIDIKGQTMPIPESAADVAIVTGHVTKAFATKELYEFGMYLRKHPLWQAQIQQINVTQAKELELVPRVGDHIIFLGKPGNYENKFKRLKTFYKKGLNEIGWNKYSRISLEFNNQIICTKKEK